MLERHKHCQRRSLVAALSRLRNEASNMTVQYKQPVSVLVVIYTAEGKVLLLERADHPGY